jgi:hypothetical protein
LVAVQTRRHWPQLSGSPGTLISQPSTGSALQSRHPSAQLVMVQVPLAQV